ncbi:MAG: redoxin domain-containing protein, partial [Bacteroidota bacterium]
MPADQYTTALNNMVTLNGVNVAELSHQQPVLLVFLRHFGCTFCREALKDLADRSQQIEGYGSKLVLVHMSDEQTAERYFSKYGLSGVAQVADPHCRFYQAFGLTKGTARQLFGLQSWIRGFQAGVLD